jgi:hypothetical protein
MNRSPVTYILILLLAATAACEKAEPELLSGDIAGVVTVYDENFYPLEDMSGVQLSLTDGSFLSQSTTDPYGRFVFQDIDYGNYQIDLEMEGYIKSFMDYTVNHLGGYSPTTVNYSLHEVPKFETWIDSIQFNGFYERCYLYVNLQGLSGFPKIGYNFWIYLSDTPDVSRDQYVAEAIGFSFLTPADSTHSEIYFEIYDSRFDQLVSDTIYLCVYPRAWGRGVFYIDHYPDALGMASNVFSFMAE